MSEITLLDLAAKIEASWPWEVDNSRHFHNMRAVDVAIARAVRWDSTIGCGRGDRYGVPAYSASLDAAMTLLPKGSFWRAGNDGDGPDPSMFFAQVSYERGAVLGFTRATAVTAVLAIASACLSARHALALSKGSDV